MAGLRAGTSLLTEGAKRLSRVKPYLMAIYLANLLLGWSATFGLAGQIGAVTGRSLYSERLVRGFDLGVFLDLINKPEVAPYSQVPVALVFSALFVVFQLFLGGGIITQYLAGSQGLERNRLYAACGENFWKLVRTALVFIVVAALVAGLFQVILSGVDARTENWTNRQAAIGLECGMLAIEALALLWVRMWFDLAQTRMIATSAPKIRSSLVFGFKSARRALGLYANYVFLGIVTALVAALGVYLWWTAAPASRVVVTFLILQSTLAFLLILRWWQRAIAAAWYQSNTPTAEAVVPVSLEPLPPESAVPEVPFSQ